MSNNTATESDGGPPRIAGSVRIVDYEPRWREDFARLNLEWVERWFTVEPVDRDVLGDPEANVLAGGGRILSPSTRAAARSVRSCSCPTRVARSS